MSKNFELLRRTQRAELLEPVSTTSTGNGPVLQRISPLLPLSTEREGLEWQNGLRILQKYWRSSALFAAAVVIMATVVTLMMKSVYEPVARIQVDPPGAEIFSLQANNTGGDAMQYLETQAKNLQSDQLAIDIIRNLHLDQSPEFVGSLKTGKIGDMASDNGLQLTQREHAALQTLRKNTAVSRDPASRLISVSVSSHDPRMAATVTNSLVNQFIEREYKMRHMAVMQSSEWLQRQLDDIRTRMEDSNRTLANFQKETGIAATGENQNTWSDQMTELSRQLMQAQADRIQLQSYLNRFSGKGSSSLPQISSNPVVQALTQKLAEVRAELAQTLAVYGKNHPNSKKLQNQVDELQAQLNGQRSAILSDLKTSYAAAQAREQLTQSQMKGTTKQLVLLAQYNALKKEADANTQLYNTLFQKIKEAGITAESKSSNIRVVDPALVLDRPTRPHRLINIAMGLLAGLLGGVILAFVRDALDTRIRTPQDIRKCLGAQPVSIVPVIGNGDGSSRKGYAQVFLLDRPNSPEAEALRGLYTSVRLSRQENPPRALLVVSPHSGDGKTTLTINLALALAQHGRTCIVDADLRKEGVAPALGVSAKHGLTEVLNGTLDLNDVLVTAQDMANLTILPTGPATPDPGALISSQAMARLTRQLQQQFEFVLIDSAPILPFADGRALAALVDGVVLVGRAGVTTREDLVRAMELLQAVRSAPVVEVVLNAAEYPAVDYRYYSRYYQYGSKTA